MAEETDLKTCPTCPLEVGPQPIGNFGVARSRNDGRNLYCKPCIRKKVTDSRQMVHAMKVARRAARAALPDHIEPLFSLLPARKPDVRAPYYRPSPEERVLDVIDHWRGQVTQRVMARETRLSKDEVGDALAELMLNQRVVASRYEPGLDQNVYFRRSDSVALRENVA